MVEHTNPNLWKMLALGHEHTERQAANFKDAAWRLGWRLGKITIDLYLPLPLPLMLDARCGHPFNVLNTQLLYMILTFGMCRPEHVERKLQYHVAHVRATWVICHSLMLSYDIIKDPFPWKITYPTLSKLNIPRTLEISLYKGNLVM